jgi:release factor glutamine methyltransferase
MSTASTIAEVLRSASETLQASSETPRLDAELLLAAVLNWSRARVLAEHKTPLAVAQLSIFEQLIARRAALEPVAYILGHKEFYGYDFFVDRRVLIPRPETELLVEETLRVATRVDRPRIADIGTGSGAIAVSLALQLPTAQIFAVDLSRDALEVAAANVARHRVGERVVLLHGDLLEPLTAPIDIIVSNPPYTVLAEIAANVRAHEPWLALDGGPDGTMIYQRLLAQAPRVLTAEGALLLEIGSWQGSLVSQLARAMFPNATIRILPDLAGHDRVLTVTYLAQG